MCTKKLIAKVEQALHEKLQEDLHIIITNTGFDSEASILGINKNIISEIEEFLNQNKEILKETSYSDCYEHGKIFKFKPGHKSVLLSLPSALDKFNKDKKKVKKQNNSIANQNEETDQSEVPSEKHHQLKQFLIH